MRIRLLALVFVSIFATHVVAQPLVDRVPADAFVYVGWSGSQSIGPAYENSKFKKFMDSSAFPQLLNETLPAILKQAADQKPDNAERIALVQDLGKMLAKHPTAIYMRGLRVADRPAKQTFPAVQVGIVCKAGADKDTVAKAFQYIAQNGGKVTAKVLTDADSVTLLMGDAQNAAGTLPDLPGYKAASEQFTADSALTVYVDVEAALSRFDENLKADAPGKDYESFIRGVEASGIKGLKRVVMSAGFNKDEWQSRLFLDALAPRKGLLKLLDPTPIDSALAGRIPPDAVSAAVVHFDFAALLATAREIMTAIDPRAVREFNKGVGAVGMSIGRRIDTEILGPLGSQWAIFASPTLGGTGPMGLVAANKLDDVKLGKAAWGDLYVALANMLPAQLNKQGVKLTPIADAEAVAGTTLYSFKTDRSPFVPCFVVHGDYIYFGLDPAVLAKAASTEWPRRDASTAYDLMASAMGVKNFTSFRYTDLPKTAPVVAGQLNGVWPMLVGPAREQGIQLPQQLFPPADQVAALVSPAGTFSWADDKGFYSRSRLPFPGAGMLGYVQGDETTLAVVGAGAVGLSVPAMMKAREQAAMVASMSNQRQLSIAIMMHANDNNNQPPPDLGALVKYVKTPRVFIAPASGTSVPQDIENGTPEQIAAWVNANSDYVYVKPPKFNMRNAFEFVVLYEKFGINGEEGVTMAFADGHCEFVKMDDAKNRLKKAGVAEPVKYEPGK